MRAELEAVEALLGPLSISVETVAALPEKLPPYFVLAPLTPSDIPDETLARNAPPLEIDLRLTAVAGTPGGALDLLLRARAILAPNGMPIFPTVAGRFVQLDWLRFEVADIDTSVKIPATNRNPAYAVDSYSLNSQPS